MKLLFVSIKLIMIFTLLLAVRSVWVHSIRGDAIAMLSLKKRLNLGVISWIFLLVFAFVLTHQSRLQFFNSEPEYQKNKRLYDMRVWFEEASTAKGGIYDRHHTEERQLAKYDRNEQSGRITRTYPLGVATSHLLGYSAVHRDRAGLEKDFLDKLMGRTKGSLSELQNNLQNNWLRLYRKGNDLVLTIDYDLQAYAYKLLRAKKRKGAVVMLEPSSGYVLAMVSTPGFDPLAVENDSLWQALSTDSENAPLYNRAIKGLYPPGSTFKIAIAAAALDKGINPKLYCSPEGVKFRGYRKRVHDHGRTHHGHLKLADAIKNSCNQYFAQLGMLLTPEVIAEKAEQLGLGGTVEWNTTNDAFQEDFRIKTGVFPKAARLDSFRTAWASIGQDQVLVSPIQMALLAAAVANGGSMPKPCLEYGRWSKSYGHVFRGSTASQLKKMMTRVVEDGGTGFPARIPGLPIAGKTGTAEVARGRPHSWFISFAPADDPKIAMAVVCENSGYGASVAAPISRKMYLKAVELGYLQKKKT